LGLLPNRTIDVLMVSTSFPSDLKDWRGLFIRHLADALASKQDIRLKLWAPEGEVHRSATFTTTPKEALWLSKLMQSGGIAHIFRSGGLNAVRQPIKLLIHLFRAYCRLSPQTDVYHINWLQNALPLPNDGKPALLTVLGTDFQLLRLPLMRSRIRFICRHRPVAICPNASWMVPPLEKAFGDCADIQEVPFGIDPRWYEIERTFTTSRSADWVTVSRLTRDKIGPLFDWCEPVFNNDKRKLHLFGPMQERLSIPQWVNYHGPVSPADLIDEWFPRSHGLITLSRHAEGRPQVMLEAMAAGLPIVASRLAAHENIITHSETGWLCDSPTEFLNGIEHLENLQENRRIGQDAREWVRDEIGTWDDCASRYQRIYLRMLQK